MQFSDAICWRHNKSKMADGRRIWNRFLAISRRHIGRSKRNLEQRWRITCRYMSRDQNYNFHKFSRHFENSIISISHLWIIRFRSHLVCRCTFEFPGWTVNKKIDIFQIQDGGQTPYWKSFFGYISAYYWPINAKFGSEMKNHMLIQVTWPKLQFSKTQDGGQLPFWK